MVGVQWRDLEALPVVLRAVRRPDLHEVDREASVTVRLRELSVTHPEEAPGVFAAEQGFPAS